MYNGEFMNNKPHGIGRLDRKNGEVYNGGWVNGIKEGKNCLIRFTDASEYLGSFANDQINGEGEYRTSDNCI
jgi:hypothetical protein